MDVELKASLGHNGPRRTPGNADVDRRGILTPPTPRCFVFPNGSGARSPGLTRCRCALPRARMCADGRDVQGLRGACRAKKSGVAPCRRSTETVIALLFHPGDVAFGFLQRISPAVRSIALAGHISLLG